jgi:hypothetical protein
MPTRRISGTRDTLSIDSGSEITYLGSTAADQSGGSNIRGFRINPSTTGDVTVTLDNTYGVNKLEIFQESSYTGSSAPTGYKTVANIAKDGKNKGVVGITVTNAALDYIVLVTLEGGSECTYGGSVVLP